MQLRAHTGGIGPAVAMQTAGHALLFQDHGVVLWKPKAWTSLVTVLQLQRSCAAAEHHEILAGPPHKMRQLFLQRKQTKACQQSLPRQSSSSMSQLVDDHLWTSSLCGARQHGDWCLNPTFGLEPQAIRLT
jgi:hypothetical protein